MTTKMHMLGFMYDLTLMLMVNYLEIDMLLLTYKGMMGTEQLGNFNTKNEEVLTPMSMRMPYAMQLGSGLNILELGTTYNGYANERNWGDQIL